MSREAAAETLERIRVSIESHSFTENNQNIPVTASLGFAAYPLLRDHTILDWEQTLELADFCLYTAKHGGRNAWVGITELHTDETLSADVSIRDAKQLIKQNKLQAISNRENIIKSL
jgi:predicted signal transduction protein with EAL and GGDEF domain